MQTFLGFDKLSDWKDFERLCADLLEAEGYIVESDPFLDRSGVDLRVVEEFRSHNNDDVIRIHWHVQCKHYAVSERNLGRKEVEESICGYAAAKTHDLGLFFITDTDYSEEAKTAIEHHIAANPDSKIKLWNRRQLLARLERHPHLLLRYGLSFPKADYLSAFSALKRFGPVRTLLISDQSPFAHHLTSGLRSVGFDVTFIPFWHYLDEARMALFSQTVLAQPYRLIVCFLGDSFSFPMHPSLIDVITENHRTGASILLFPFLAWSLKHGLNAPLGKIVPVRLSDVDASGDDQDIKIVSGSSLKGDFKWLLRIDSFAEDRYIELDPADAPPTFTAGIQSRFGLSHSFEYLRLIPGAQTVWADTTGNPFIVVNEAEHARVCYFNSCCHSCLSPVAVTSPMEASPEASRLAVNALNWLLS